MRRSDVRRGLVALLLALIALPLMAQSMRIGVVTMQPGEVFFERFGHNAVVVQPAEGRAISYNFGYFDPSEADFIPRFIRGEMRYQLVPLYLDDDLRQYREAGRGVSVQWLNLQPADAERLAAALVLNARAENAHYDYRYFTDNCSTRVRDAIDLALNGALKTQLVASSQGNTYRSEAVRLAWPAWWMAAGFDIGLSGHADRPLSRWEDSFVPMRLAAALRDVKTSNGQPLVADEEVILPHRLSLPPEDRPARTGVAFLAGLLLATVIVGISSRRPQLATALAGGFWAIAGLVGCLLAFLWLGTGHTFAHANQNLWLLSPLCLLLLPGVWRAWRGKPVGRRFAVLQVAILVGVLVAAFLLILPGARQQNGLWLLLLGPLHWAFARHFRRLGTPR